MTSWPVNGQAMPAWSDEHRDAQIECGQAGRRPAAAAPLPAALQQQRLQELAVEPVCIGRQGTGRGWWLGACTSALRHKAQQGAPIATASPVQRFPAGRIAARHVVLGMAEPAPLVLGLGNGPAPE